ncbi:MAG: hypothetical protein WCC92_06545, partial [Candidatus Korobacteraceae bacterium]
YGPVIDWLISWFGLAWVNGVRADLLNLMSHNLLLRLLLHELGNHLPSALGNPHIAKSVAPRTH